MAKTLMRPRLEPEADHALIKEPSVPEAAPRSRLVSLDAFRGLTILLMLLVNNIALDIYTPQQLVHAPWNAGLHLADYVMPWFLLCVGLSIPFSNRSFVKTELPPWRYELRILGRGAALVLIGCLIESAIEKKPVFSMGVLQLIGFAYLFGAWLYNLPAPRRAVVAFFMLLSYGLALKYLPVPGAHPGSLSESANLIENLNRTYFGAYNLEGVLCAIPTGALILLGTLVGDSFINHEDHVKRLAPIVGIGLAMIVVGQFWSNGLPYNKAIWTPSYLLFTGGIGTLLLAGFYLSTDAIGKTKWPFVLVVFGSNAIAAYALPILVKLTMFGVWKTGPAKAQLTLQDATLNWFVVHLGRVPGGWFYTIAYIASWWLVLWGLYRRKIFLRV